MASASEEVSSFQLKAKVLETTLAELHDLKEEFNGNSDRQWKSELCEISYLKEMTQRFLKFIRKMSLEASNYPTAIQGACDNRYLPNKSVVLPGNEIYNIIFTGTKGDDINAQGEY